MKLSIHIKHKVGSFQLQVNVTVAESATGVFGHSGSGKTLLMRCIAGLERPDEGRIELDGDTLFDSARNIFIPPHKRSIGMVFQEPRLFPHWSVRRNLHAGTESHLSQPPYTEKQVIELSGIAPLLDRSVQQLSGGEKQRVALARALLAYPRLLLLDEPVSALDTRLKARIMPFLNRIHRELGIPCLYVSHDLSEILQLSEDIILLNNGCIADHGKMEDIVHHEEMRELIDSTLAAKHDFGPGLKESATLEDTDAKVK
jgi:molybdate transport system ATP-binding protein